MESWDGYLFVNSANSVQNLLACEVVQKVQDLLADSVCKSIIYKKVTDLK